MKQWLETNSGVLWCQIQLGDAQCAFVSGVFVVTSFESPTSPLTLQWRICCTDLWYDVYSLWRSILCKFWIWSFLYFSPKWLLGREIARNGREAPVVMNFNKYSIKDIYKYIRSQYKNIRIVYIRKLLQKCFFFSPISYISDYIPLLLPRLPSQYHSNGLGNLGNPANKKYSLNVLKIYSRVSRITAYSDEWGELLMKCCCLVESII